MLAGLGIKELQVVVVFPFKKPVVPTVTLVCRRKVHNGGSGQRIGLIRFKPFGHQGVAMAQGSFLQFPNALALVR